MHFVFCNISSCCIHVFIFWWEAEHWGLPCYEYANTLKSKLILFRTQNTTTEQSWICKHIQIKTIQMFFSLRTQTQKIQIYEKLNKFIPKYFHHKFTFHVFITVQDASLVEINLNSGKYSLVNWAPLIYLMYLSQL